MFDENMKRITILAVLLIAVLAGTAISWAEQKILFRENFSNLTAWKPLTFPKIKTHSTYRLEPDGGKSILKAESHASASAIVYYRTFNIYENPCLHWRWKITELSSRGNPKEKSGDDYPIRVYVLFQYDPASASLGERLTYNAAKIIYGKYPPQSTLNYVWTGTNISERFITSPFTKKARIIILERGIERVGQWVEESVNVLADYRKVFGKDPPAIAGLAIMSDTDNTGTSAVAYLDFIEVGK